MTLEAKTFHGSDLEKIEDVYGIPKEKIVSFSANVNPLGFSKKAAEALKNNLDVISRYPDRDYTGLKKAIAAYTKADEAHMLLGNGVTELISLFITITAPKRAVVIGPTYSEYERDLTRLQCSISHILAKESADFILTCEEIINNTPDDTDLVILCNPNNPTSGAIRKQELRKIAADYQQRNILLLIDETYVEFSAHADEITAADLTGIYDNLFVLRGTSKFFATPGLRLGYALTSNQTLLEKAARNTDPWNINSAAELVGTVMFQDTDYIRLVRQTMEAEKEYICHSLQTIPGIRLYPVNSNFVLVRLPAHSMTSGELFDILIRQGMMVRNCSTFPTLGQDFIRICFMSHADNERLVAAIKKALD